MSASPEPVGSGPLAGVRVLDLSTVLAGPFACQLLGDLGADVVKVEHPKIGDPMRRMGATKDGLGLWWKVIARNKRSVGLDLHDPECKEILLALVEKADLIVENFRPGTLARWGVGYEEIKSRNPSAVLVHVTGFGQEGPYSARPAYGTLAEAMSGVAMLARDDEGKPILPIFGMADGVAGFAAALAGVAALFAAKGKEAGGQEVDMSLVEPIMSLIGPQPTVYTQLGYLPEKPTHALRDLYQTQDGAWVAISATTEGSAERVMRVVGGEEFIDQDWFPSFEGRNKHTDEIGARIRGWIGSRSREDVMAGFAAGDAAIAPIYDTQDILDDPQLTFRESVTSVPDPDFGEVAMQNVIFRYSETPCTIRHTGRALGEDTEAVLIDELGLDRATVEALRSKGLVA